MSCYLIEVVQEMARVNTGVDLIAKTGGLSVNVVYSLCPDEAAFLIAAFCDPTPEIRIWPGFGPVLRWHLNPARLQTLEALSELMKED